GKLGQRIAVARAHRRRQPGAELVGPCHLSTRILRREPALRHWRGRGGDDLLGFLLELLGRSVLLAAGGAGKEQGDGERPDHPALRASSSPDVSTRRGAASSAAP